MPSALVLVASCLLAVAMSFPYEAHFPQKRATLAYLKRASLPHLATEGNISPADHHFRQFPSKRASLAYLKRSYPEMIFEGFNGDNPLDAGDHDYDERRFYRMQPDRLQYPYSK